MYSSEIIFAALTLILPFLSGMIFFSKWLFRDVQVKWGTGFVSQLLFSATLAVAFQTHVVILGEVSGIIDRAARNELWMVDFIAMIALLKVIVPFFLFLTLFMRQLRYPVLIQVFFAMVSECIWLAATSWGSGVFDLHKETERLGVVGLASVAILSGWGSVYGPYSYGPWFIKKFDDAEIERVETKLLSVMEMLSAIKRRQCAALYLSAAYHPSMLKPGKVQSFGVSLMKIFRKEGDLDLQEAAVMPGEATKADALSLLSTELFLELTEMRRAKQANIFRQTLLGKVYTFLGYAFAVYCVLKMIASVWGIVFPKKAEDPDLITRVISFGLLLARDREEAQVLAQVISTSMVGILVFNSFRGLLVTMGKIFHQIGPRDSSFVALLLTEIMGQYLLSSIIILDMNVPHKYRGDLFYKRFEFFRVWSDALFIFAGLASAVLIYALDKAQGSRTEFYSTTVHEKLI